MGWGGWVVRVVKLAESQGPAGELQSLDWDWVSKAAWPGNPSVECDVGVASRGVGLGMVVYLGQDWL